MLNLLCFQGNSGGPVFNEKGDVVGIAFSGLTGGAENIGLTLTIAFYLSIQHQYYRLRHPEAGENNTCLMNH